MMRGSFGTSVLCFLSLASSARGIIHTAPVQGKPWREFRELYSHLPSPQIITGLYANDTASAQIVIHDTNGVVSWTWSVDDVQSQAMPAKLLGCMQAKTAVPEAKWANGGSSVIAVYNYAALVINHLPGDALDKKITFGVCLDGADMANTHSLELVPDGKLAVATTSDDYHANIKIFNVSSGIQPDSNPAQHLSLLPAVHSLVWDQTERLLWAVGSTNPPNGTAPSKSTLRAYKYSQGSFEQQPVHDFNISDATILTAEWNGTEYSNWWDGGHDVIGMPRRRKLLISTDLDLHVFDIPSKTFEAGSIVVEKYLPGFAPMGHRIGADGLALPRSDVKSLSIDANDNVLYVQATWQDVVSNQTNLVGNGELKPALVHSRPVYRSRWFIDTVGWPKASIPS